MSFDEDRQEKIAVVVPSYNHERYLERCLRSVLGQSRVPDRLIVIDDGSSDGSVAVCERVLRDCPVPVEFIARSNRGLCATLNEGLARTEGVFFAYLGSDDLWLPTHLERLAELLKLEPTAQAAYGPCYVVDDDDRIEGVSSDWSRYSGGDIFPSLLVARSAPMSPTVLFRREAIVAVGGWRTDSRLEDFDLLLRLAARGPFAYDPAPTSAWRRHASNTSKSVEMMFVETVAAQRRAAEAVGLDEAERRRVYRSVLFQFADYFLRAGDRWRALRMSLEGLAGAPSAEAAVRRAIRLASPGAILSWRERQLGKRARSRAGERINADGSISR